MAKLINQTFRFGQKSGKRELGKYQSDKRDFAKSHNIIRLSIMLMMAQASTGFAAELVKTIPAQSFNIPAGDLTKALSAYSANAGVLLSFDSELTHGKNTQGLKGQYSVNEGFANLLKGTGLEVINNQKGELELRKAPAVKVSEADNLPLNKELSTVEVRAKRFYEIGPLPGLGLTKDQIPGNVQSITAKEIKESHSLSITDLMNKKLQSVTVNDYQGNPFQMDVQYRGFTAGPQIGTPQGLSVFFDGIRVNEPFGDVVNWDMIPMNALASVDVFPGSNPIFGLNTLGGAFTVKTKDGFNNEGFDAEVLYGSFNRKQLQVEGGWNNGTVALFGAGNFFLEDGWRENSPSKVNQFFGKASYRGDKLDLNLSTLIVGTDLTGNGLLPSEEYARDRNSVFTSPDTTENRLQQFQLSGAFQATDSFSITSQVYRRNSKRKQTGADVFTDYSDELLTQRIRNAGEEATCLLAESEATNDVPLYYVIPVQADAFGNADISGTQFVSDINDNFFSDPAFPDGRFYVNPADYQTNANVPLPDDMAALMRQVIAYNKNFRESLTFNRDPNIANPNLITPPPVTDASGNPRLDGSGNPLASYRVGVSSSLSLRSFLGDNPGSNISSLSLYSEDIYFYTPDPDQTNNPGGLIKNFVVLAGPTNNDACFADRIANTAFRDAGLEVPIDGAGDTGNPAGVVIGTPTAIINNNQIDQITDGASIQFNWNLEKHKFMVGASIDAASAEYKNSSQLGFLTANRAAYLDPTQAHPMFIGAYVPLSNNNFEGTNTTKSIYFSETWSPVETWNFSASGRYNETQTKNKIAARRGNNNFSIGNLISVPDDFNVCEGDCTVNRPPTNFKPYLGFETLDKAETEKFSFYSFNPSLGATWQAKENLNLFANWAQGTRTPSVIELGCAFDSTPIYIGPADRTPEDLNNPSNYEPKSINENRQCTLPTTLSGDPFLPQIKATTYDIGMRGNLNNFLGATNLQWNFGAYQTDLKDDIYFVAVGNGAGFFDSIGKTRRRGLEAGLSGRKDKWGFSVNYALTDATFEDNFRLISDDNSSATDKNDGFGNAIDVKPGNRIPGVALHNLNANVSYQVTSKWQVGLSAVMHSESFVRGNENNGHRKGVAVIDRENPDGTIIYKQPTSNPGKVSGFATFNFQTSYKFNPEWTASMLVNNLFDREYFTAGRLGRNPFSPSINGAIGPDGYNHNSNDWASTNFIAPSAPRGIWFSLNWQFVPDKK